MKSKLAFLLVVLMILSLSVSGCTSTKPEAPLPAKN